MREAHVPAQHPKAQEDPRLPRADANARWTGCAEGAARARPQAALGLIQAVRDRATFEALAHARPVRRGPVSVRVVAGDGRGPARVAYTVGRGVGGAAARNRARRRLRAAVRNHAGSLRGGDAYLVGAGREALTMPFAALARSVGDALRDAGARP
jgi:ribonuclease P protein component